MRALVRTGRIFAFVIGMLLGLFFHSIGFWMGTKGPAVDRVLRGNEIAFGNLNRKDNWMLNFKVYAYPSQEVKGYQYLQLIFVPRTQTLPNVPIRNQEVMFELTGFERGVIKPFGVVPSELISNGDKPFVIVLDMLYLSNPEKQVSQSLLVINSKS